MELSKDMYSMSHEATGVHQLLVFTEIPVYMAGHMAFIWSNTVAYITARCLLE